jgi:hypothetical protein
MARLGTLEITSAIWFRNRQSEGPEGFAVLYKVIQVIFDISVPWRSEQTAISECPRAELRRPLEPSDDFARSKKSQRFLDLLVFSVRPVIGSFAIIEDLLDFLVRITRTPVQPR